MVLKPPRPQILYCPARFTDYVGGFRISCRYFSNNHADIDAMAAAMRSSSRRSDAPRLPTKPLSPLHSKAGARRRKFAGGLACRKVRQAESLEPRPRTLDERKVQGV